MPITKSQERRFVHQHCVNCNNQKCDFPLEWRENCSKWHQFVKANQTKRD